MYSKFDNVIYIYLPSLFRLPLSQTKQTQIYIKLNQCMYIGIRDRNFFFSFDIFYKLMSANFENNNLMHSAAAKNDVLAIRKLYGNGFNIESVNSFGWTPLMQASRNGHFEAVNLLLKLGANGKAKNKFGKLKSLTTKLNGGILSSGNFFFQAIFRGGFFPDT